MLKHSAKRMGMYFLDDDIPLSLNGGTIPSIEDMEELSLKILNFLDKYTQSDIDKYNQNHISDIYSRFNSNLKEKKQSLGYVYIIRGENFRYKIGCSKNPKQRLETLKLSSCENHILIHSYKTDNMYAEERRLHDMFNDYRCHSEWFDLPSQSIDYIMGLSDEG